MSSSLSYRLARHGQAQAYVVWRRRSDAAAYQSSEQWDGIDTLSIYVDRANSEPVDHSPLEWRDGWEELEKQSCERWEQEQAEINSYFRATQTLFFSLAASDAIAVSTEAALQAQAALSAKSTAPVPTAPGGRVVSDLSLTPRLLAQRPQVACALRAG